MLTIVDIISEAQQGVTRPFLCRCDDGQDYYAKRRNAGRKAQMCEWIAASLAKRLPLPIPAFGIAEVPRALLDLRAPEERRDWGEGPVFVSRAVPDAVEIRFTDLTKVPLRLRAAILLFDAWIGNDDRTLGFRGGNPNLLWSDRTQEVTMIDHNLAFTATPQQVLAEYVFAEAATAWGQEFATEWSAYLVAAVQDLPHIWDAMPDIWIEDGAGVLALEQVRERLQIFTDARNPEWAIR